MTARGHTSRTPARVARRARARGASGRAIIRRRAVVARLAARDAEDGRTLASVDEWLDAYANDDGDAPAGVFATYDDGGACTYVDYARDVRTALRAARARGGARVARARVLAFRNGAMATRENLSAEAARWRAALGEARPVLNAEWDAEDEAASGGGGAATASEVVDGGVGGVVSPFAAAAAAAMTSEEGVVDADADADAPRLELTAENVDKALDEVRPYLVADGGNVELIKIEDGIVVVRLNGACGSCASSAATMKGGIEKLLKQKFGAAIEEVVNVSGELEEMSVEKLEEHLDKLRKSIASYGGEVSVESLERGVCVLRFKGPQALAFSIAQALKNKFPLVRECKIRQVN